MTLFHKFSWSTSHKEDEKSIVLHHKKRSMVAVLFMRPQNSGRGARAAGKGYILYGFSRL
jgi:hypothetical protein